MIAYTEFLARKALVVPPAGMTQDYPLSEALFDWQRDIVLSPFAGIGSEGYVAVQEGRKFVGCELKGSYYRQAVNNLHNAKSSQAELFAI